MNFQEIVNVLQEAQNELEELRTRLETTFVGESIEDNHNLHNEVADIVYQSCYQVGDDNYDTAWCDVDEFEFEIYGREISVDHRSINLDWSLIGEKVFDKVIENLNQNGFTIVKKSS